MARILPDSGARPLRLRSRSTGAHPPDSRRLPHSVLLRGRPGPRIDRVGAARRRRGRAGHDLSCSAPMRQGSVLWSGDHRHEWGINLATVESLAGLGLAIAALATLRSVHRTTKERDHAEDLHWDSMEAIRVMSDLAGRPWREARGQARDGARPRTRTLPHGGGRRLAAGGRTRIRSRGAGSTCAPANRRMRRRCAVACAPTSIAPRAARSRSTTSTTTRRSPTSSSARLGAPGRCGPRRARLRGHASAQGPLLRDRERSAHADGPVARDRARASRTRGAGRSDGRTRRPAAGREAATGVRDPARGGEAGRRPHRRCGSPRRVAPLRAPSTRRSNGRRCACSGWSAPKPRSPSSSATTVPTPHARRIAPGVLLESLVAAAARVAPRGRIEVSTGATDASNGSGDATLRVTAHASDIDAERVRRAVRRPRGRRLDGMPVGSALALDRDRASAPARRRRPLGRGRAGRAGEPDRLPAHRVRRPRLRAAARPKPHAFSRRRPGAQPSR